VTKNNIADFSKYVEKTKVIPVINAGEKPLSAKDLAKQEKIEKELVRIQKRYKRLANSLKEVDTDVQANIKVLKYCFTMSHRLLPVAEEIFVRYKNERAVYAINGLVSQIRELAADLRMLSSNDKTVEYILNAVFLPSLQMVMQHITSDFAELREAITESLPPKKSKDVKLKMSKMIKGYGQLLNDAKKDVTEKVERHFQ
jgi:hypothetical protein